MVDPIRIIQIIKQLYIEHIKCQNDIIGYGMILVGYYSITQFEKPTSFFCAR